MGPVRRSLLVGLLLLGWALPVAIPPQVAAQQRITEPIGVYIDRGILAYDDKKYAEALQNFLEAYRIDPTSAEARYFVGITYLALDQVDEAIGYLAKARQLDPADLDIAFNLGVAYFTKSDYTRAQAQFLVVYGKEPTRDNLGYYLGFIHFDRKEYDKALGYFQANVSTDVRFQQQNRFYTGLTKHHLGRDVEATQDLEEAVKLRPDAPLGRTAKLFAEAIAPKPEPRRYRVEIRGGVSYDDNASLAPTNHVLGLRTPTRRSPAEIGLGRFEYDLVRSQTDTLTASYQIFSNTYESVDRLNVLNHTWAGNYVHRGKLGSLPAWYGAQHSYDYLLLDQHLFLSRHTGTASLTLFENDTNFTQFQYRFQDKDFHSRNALDLRQEGRDGQNHMLGVTHILAFAGGRHFVRFGYQADVDDTIGADYWYVGQRASAGFQVTGPWDIRFQLGYDFQFRDYPNKNRLASTLNQQAESGSFVQGARFRVMRRDSDHTFTASLSRDFAYGQHLLNVALDFFKERNSSTFSLFDFDRNVVTLSVGWKF